MDYQWLAIAMFAGFCLMLMTGYPVAFSFARTAIVFGLVGWFVEAFDPSRLLLLPNIWFGTMSSLTLLAIPFFVFLGAVLEKSGLAEELLEAIGIVLGPVRGGMALAVIFVGTILAAATGVVAATVIMMGMISLPVMLRYGYDKQLAAGVIVASGTLAQLIPENPSILGTKPTVPSALPAKYLGLSKSIKHLNATIALGIIHLLYSWATMNTES